MTNADQRIERLEEKLRAKGEPRIMILTNVAPYDGEDAPNIAKVGHDRWAIAIVGEPFTDDEIRELREEYKDRAR